MGKTFFRFYTFVVVLASLSIVGATINFNQGNFYYAVLLGVVGILSGTLAISGYREIQQRL